MRRTHLSLYYLLSYLLAGGVGLMAAPDVALRLFLSSGSYGDVLPRLTGMLMLGLAIIVFAIIRLKAEAMYPVTLAVRLFFLVGLAALYAYSRDPFFLVILAIVAVGVGLTGALWLKERGAGPAAG